MGVAVGVGVGVACVAVGACKSRRAMLADAAAVGIEAPSSLVPDAIADGDGAGAAAPRPPLAAAVAARPGAGPTAGPMASAGSILDERRAITVLTTMPASSSAPTATARNRPTRGVRRAGSTTGAAVTTAATAVATLGIFGAVLTSRVLRATRRIRSIEVREAAGAIGSSASARSATLARRSSRDFIRQRATTSSRMVGASGRRARSDGAGVDAMSAHRPCIVSACQTGSPVTSS